MASNKIEIYVGDVLLRQPESAAATSGDNIANATQKLAGIGEQLAALFAAMRPRDAAAYVGAEVFEIEVGFSIEIQASGVLRLVLSPKVGMSCKAKMVWKAPTPPPPPT